MARASLDPIALRQAAAANHRSWFARGRERFELDGVALFLGRGDAVLAFPADGADPTQAVAQARSAGVREIGCWALSADESLGGRLTALGFQNGWAPHWMGIDPRGTSDEPGPGVEETTTCAPDLPYASEAHDAVLGGDVHHFLARDGSAVAAGHAVLNVAGESAGLYDMGVTPAFRRRGHGRALTLAALAYARGAGCTSVTLNATGEGEPLYRSAGFVSLGHGMTWWLFP